MPEKNLNSPFLVTFLFLLFISVVYLINSTFMGRDVISGNDLLRYTQVYEKFRYEGFDFQYPIGISASSEPLFWFFIFLAALTFSYPEVGFSFVFAIYFLLALYLTPAAYRFRFCIFLITISLTFTFANSVGNTIRSYCATVLLVPLIFRVLTHNLSGVKSLILVGAIFFTHYGAGFFALLLYFSQRKVSSVALVALGVAGMFAADLGVLMTNLFYKASVYSSLNYELGKNTLIIYTVALSLMASLVVDGLGAISRLHFLIFLMMCVFAWLYYYAGFHGLGRFSIFVLLYVYSSLFLRFEKHVLKLPLTWLVMPAYLSFRLAL